MVNLFKFAKDNYVTIEISPTNIGYTITLSRNVHHSSKLVSDDVVEYDNPLEYVLNAILIDVNKSEKDHKELIEDWKKRVTK